MSQKALSEKNVQYSNFEYFWNSIMIVKNWLAQYIRKPCQKQYWKNRNMCKKNRYTVMVRWER